MSEQEIVAWLKARLPQDWFTEEPEIDVDRDEILVIGRLAEPDEAGDEAAKKAAAEGAVARWRDETRGKRVEIAREAERKFDRKVSWGARSGEVGLLFTHLSVPAMTRLRMRERRVLDTLVDAGVARSRSDALGWCVRLVADNEKEWLDELSASLKGVKEARGKGPVSKRTA